METKHTPGPWRVSGPNTGLQYNVQTDKEHVALISHKRMPIEDATACANAHLIAAAPDLLEALKECITEDGALAWNSAELAGRRLEAISNIARAAILKATGEAVST